jgi:hypothetical protein
MGNQSMIQFSIFQKIHLRFLGFLSRVFTSKNPDFTQQIRTVFYADHIFYLLDRIFDNFCFSGRLQAPNLEFPKINHV